MRTWSNSDQTNSQNFLGSGLVAKNQHRHIFGKFFKLSKLFMAKVSVIGGDKVLFYTKIVWPTVFLLIIWTDLTTIVERLFSRPNIRMNVQERKAPEDSHLLWVRRFQKKTLVQKRCLIHLYVGTGAIVRKQSKLPSSKYSRLCWGGGRWVYKAQATARRHDS